MTIFHYRALSFLLCKFTYICLPLTQFACLDSSKVQLRPAKTFALIPATLNPISSLQNVRYNRIPNPIKFLLVRSHPTVARQTLPRTQTSAKAKWNPQHKTFPKQLGLCQQTWMKMKAENRLPIYIKSKPNYLHKFGTKKHSTLSQNDNQPLWNSMLNR